jgi:hypothetical protein
MELMTGNSATTGDRRERRRFSINVPVTLVNGAFEIPAYTRDLSNQGIYFYVMSVDSFSVGQDFEFLVELPPEVTLSTCSWIRCRGRLVRVESSSSDLTGMAAEILQYSILGERRTGT